MTRLLHINVEFFHVCVLTGRTVYVGTLAFVREAEQLIAADNGVVCCCLTWRFIAQIPIVQNRQEFHFFVFVCAMCIHTALFFCLHKTKSTYSSMIYNQ